LVKVDAVQRASILSEKATGISGHFERIRDGAMPNVRSPLFKGQTSESIQGKWKEVLSRYADRFPRLIAYEDTRWSKFGQQGGFPPLRERMSDLELYFTRFKPAPIRKSPEYDQIVKIVRDRLFKSHSLRALTPEQVLKSDIEEDKVNTNSGLPDFSKRNAPEVQSKAVQDAKSGKWKEYPAVLGSRSIRQKSRFIFMFPMSTNLVEKQYVIPIMDAIRSHKVLSFSAWEGFDDVEIAMHQQHAFSAKYKASMDYKGMDQTMAEDQMRIVYDIVAPVFQPKYRAGLLESLLHCVNIPIMHKEDEMIIGTHGLASGSGWTNLAESIMSEFVHELINQRVPLVGNQLLGDDGAMTHNDNINFAQVIEECSSLCGLEAEESKQDLSEDTLHYLQRFFDKDIKIEGTDIVAGCYPTVLALNAGMNPERFHDPRKWNERMEILRWIMILENCHHSPLFHEIVDFFCEGDIYRLGINIPGYFKRRIVQDYKVAKTINNFVPSYNQASKDRSIEDFDTVKYLKSKIKSGKGS